MIIDMNNSIETYYSAEINIPRNMRVFHVFGKHSGKAMVNQCLKELAEQDKKIQELEKQIKEILNRNDY